MSPDKQVLAINFKPGGTARTLYDESVDLAELGDLQIRRGSHVEPIESGPHAGKWFVDFSPVGHFFCIGPFTKRSTALQAEHRWLLENWVCPKPDKAVT